MLKVMQNHGSVNGLIITTKKSSQRIEVSFLSFPFKTSLKKSFSRKKKLNRQKREMKMRRLRIIKPKRRSMRISVGTKKIWSLSIHWMMKISSQKQVLAVCGEMVRSKNLTDCWLTGGKSVVKPCCEWARTCYFLLSFFCDIPSYFGQACFECHSTLI